jgi:hypothetical protein
MNELEKPEPARDGETVATRTSSKSAEYVPAYNPNAVPPAAGLLVENVPDTAHVACPGLLAQPVAV